MKLKRRTALLLSVLAAYITGVLFIVRFNKMNLIDAGVSALFILAMFVLIFVIGGILSAGDGDA